MSLPRWISLAGSVALAFGASAAQADLLPENMTYVPVKLTLDGQESLADSSVVIQNCAKSGSHAFTIAKPGETLECRTVKRALDVRAVPKKDLKPLEDLLAANKGWALELGEADKLLAKTPSCGKVEVTGLVERAKNIDHILAKYAVAKAGAGCSLKKIELTNVTRDAVGGGAGAGSTQDGGSAPSAVPSDAGTAPAAASASAPPAASASVAPASTPAPVASASSAPTSAPPQKSGCAASGASTNGAGVFGLALAFAVLLRVRRGSRPER